MVFTFQPPFWAGLSGYCAELASAIIGVELGLPVTHLDDHAAYIGDWISLLKDEPRAMMTAAARAEEAAGLILALGGRQSLVFENMHEDDEVLS